MASTPVTPRANGNSTPPPSEFLIERLENLLADVETPDIAPLIEALMRRRAAIDEQRSKPPLADPSLYLLHQWGILSLRCFNSLRHICGHDPEADLLDYPKLSDAARVPIRKLLDSPNFHRASLMELALAADDYGHVLRERGGLFEPSAKDMEAARDARAARLHKDQQRWHMLSLLLHERDDERLSWTELALRHGRSARPLRIALQEHQKLMLFQASNALPPGRSRG